MASKTDERMKKWLQHIEDNTYKTIGDIEEATNYSRRQILATLCEYDRHHNTRYHIDMQERKSRGKKKVPTSENDTQVPLPTAVDEAVRKNLHNSLRLADLEDSIPVVDALYFKDGSYEIRDSPIWLNHSLKQAMIAPGKRQQVLNLFYPGTVDFNDINSRDVGELTGMDDKKRTEKPEPERTTYSEEQVIEKADIELEEKRAKVEEKGLDVEKKRREIVKMDLEIERTRRMLEGERGGDISSKVLELVLPKIIEPPKNPTVAERLEEMKALKEVINPAPPAHELEQRRGEAQARLELMRQQNARMDEVRREMRELEQKNQDLQVGRMEEMMERMREELNEARNRPSPVEQYVALHKQLKDMGIVTEKDDPTNQLQRESLDRLEKQLAQIRLETAQILRDIALPIARLQVKDMEWTLMQKHGIEPSKVALAQAETLRAEEEALWTETLQHQEERAGPSGASTPRVEEVQRELDARARQVQAMEEELEKNRRELNRRIEDYNNANAQLAKEAETFIADRRRFQEGVASAQPAPATISPGDLYMCSGCNEMKPGDGQVEATGMCAECYAKMLATALAGVDSETFAAAAAEPEEEEGK